MENHIARIIREKLNIKRIDPRRFYLVNDGAYRWIGDRANLTAERARILGAVDAEDDETVTEEQYSTACNRAKCIASECGAGFLDWDDIPEDWSDGTALGPIAPL